MSTASLHRVCFAVLAPVLVSVALISGWVIPIAVVQANDGLDPSLTAQDVGKVLGNSLVGDLVPVTFEDLDAADRSRALPSGSLVADDQGSLWSTLAPVRRESERPAMRPSLPRSGQAVVHREPQTGSVPSEFASRAADVGDVFPHSRAATPLLVAALEGSLADAGSVATTSASFRPATFRPMAGAVVGVRPSYLRPHFGTRN